MKNKAIKLLSLVAITQLFTGCEAIEAIFKAGMGVGIFIVIAVVVLIVWIISRMRK